MGQKETSQKETIEPRQLARSAIASSCKTYRRPRQPAKPGQGGSRKGMRPLRQRNGSRVIVSPPRETDGGFFMSKRKSGAHAAESPSPREIVCTLVVDAIIDEFEVEICCERTDGVDRVFSTSMDWLRAERPSEDTLAYSVETLLFGIITRCLRYVGEPVDARAGLLLQS